VLFENVLVPLLFVLLVVLLLTTGDPTALITVIAIAGAFAVVFATK
jgi:hypothetical protein